MNTIKEIELSKLIPTPENPRKIPKKPDADLKTLVKSIKARGVLHPVIARPHPEKKRFYDLRAGARRHRAAKIAGLKTIPVNVLELTDREAAEVTVAENKDRRDLNPLEEAKAVDLLLGHSSLEDAAATYDRTIPWIKRRAKLLDLEPCWKKAVLGTGEDGYYAAWPARNFEQIARLPKTVQNAVHEALERDGRECPITYTELKTYLADSIFLLVGASWKLDDDSLVKGAVACSKCPKRSSIEPELFSDLDPVAKKNQSDDRCLDTECWEKKFDAHLKTALKQAQKEHGKNMLVIASLWEEQEAYRNNILSYSVSPSKKGAKDAVPAFDLKSAKVQWILDPKARSSKSQEGPMSLKERREKLQKRREVKAVAALIEILDNNITGAAREMDKIALIDEDLFRGLAVFGTNTTAGEAWLTEEGGHSDWDKFQDFLDPETTRKQLLSALLRVFVSRLNPKAYDAPHTTEARRMANYIDIDFEALLTRATDSIKEPVSWAKLNNDGTPKKRPKKKQPTPEEKELAEAARSNLSKTTSAAKPVTQKPAKKTAAKKKTKR